MTRSRTLAFPFLHMTDLVPHLIDLLPRSEARVAQGPVNGRNLFVAGCPLGQKTGQLDLFDPTLGLGM